MTFETFSISPDGNVSILQRIIINLWLLNKQPKKKNVPKHIENNNLLLH